MVIKKLAGTSTRLYSLVAPLVMKNSVLRQNNNYPFRTSDRHVWFVAIDGCSVAGFMPVEVKDRDVEINNYYVAGDDPELLTALIQETVRAYGRGYKIVSVAHTRHVETFKQIGFTPVRTWKLYMKMAYERKGNEPVSKCI